MRVLLLLGLMVCAAEAETNVVLQILAKVRIGNCKEGCDCNGDVDELQAAEMKLEALIDEANMLQNDIVNASAANSSVNNAGDAVQGLTNAINGSGRHRRYRRGVDTVTFTSCEDSTQLLQGQVADVTIQILNGIKSALDTAASSFEVTKLDCYTNLAKDLTAKLRSGELNIPSDTTAILQLASEVTTKVGGTKTKITNAIDSLEKALDKKNAEIEAQKQVVQNLGGTVEAKTTSKDEEVTTKKVLTTGVQNVTPATFMATTPTPANESTTVSSGLTSSTNSSADTATYSTQSTLEVNLTSATTAVSSTATSSPQTESNAFSYCTDDWISEIPDDGASCPTSSTTSTPSATSALHTTPGFFTTTATQSTTASTTTVSTTTPSKCPTQRLFGDQCWDGSKGSKRIMGGEPANQNEFPYHVGLVVSGSYTCGGSIISKLWVLTAAHCVHDFEKNCTIQPSKLKILYKTVSQKSSESVQAKQIVVHEKAKIFINPTYAVNDIALVKVEKDFDFSLPGVKPICFVAQENYENIAATVTGWGYVPKENGYPDDLRKVTLDVITNRVCTQQREAARSKVPPVGTFVCTFTKDKDVTGGDSGGPLVIQVDGCWIQLGIVSYGTSCAALPAVYTRVSFFAGWIKDNAK